MEKGSRDLYAMKIIRKEEVIKKKQEGHIRAERDIMAAASHLDPIVKLYHSFQDKVRSSIRFFLQEKKKNVTMHFPIIASSLWCTVNRKTSTL